jgi:hypothetical protein
MTGIEYASTSLHFILALLLLWIFFFYPWRQYRVDALRERLFQIRGDLFDYAASGEVSFENPAYGKLRVLMNGMIRFAHKFTFSRLVMILLFRRLFEALPVPAPLAEWKEALSALPEAQQNRLREFHGKMMCAIIWHITSGSPILLAIFLVRVLRHFSTRRSKPFDDLDLPGARIVEVEAITAELQEQECGEPVPA